MKVLLVLPPTADKPAYAEPPSGLLYVASALKRAGHQAAILDAYREYLSPVQLVEHVAAHGFEAVGFGGITTCYYYVKEASNLLREKLPRVHLLAGGVLSSAQQLLLTKTPLDVICTGEGEITVVNIINRFAENSRDFTDMKGVSYLKDGKVMTNPPQEYIEKLDDIPFPDYSLVDMTIYAHDAMSDSFFNNDEESRRFYKPGMKVFNLKTARGCSNSCAFCYRHLHGYRQHSVRYVIDHILYLKNNYNIHFYRFGDELFTRDRGWVMDFAQTLIDEGLQIKFIIHGVRTDNVDAELMDKLEEAGCVVVFVGFESGSATMLKEMKKNVTVEQNISAVRVILASGLNVLVQTVVGMPSETDETIRETIDALIKTGVSDEWVTINYAQAYPGTWLWYYATKNNIIVDQEDYLVKLGHDNNYFLNYTALPTSVTRLWSWQMRKGMAAQEYRNTRSLLAFIKGLDPRVYGFICVSRRDGLMAALTRTWEYIKKRIA